MNVQRTRRHARACRCQSGLPDLQFLIMRKSGGPDFRWHPRLHGINKQDVDGRDKPAHDTGWRGADTCFAAVARMSEANAGRVTPGFRCAHPGYLLLEKGNQTDKVGNGFLSPRPTGSRRFTKSPMRAIVSASAKSGA